jgi:uncharacterized protein DUF4019
MSGRQAAMSRALVLHSPSRRALLRVAVAAAPLLLAIPARAQDARQTIVQAIARDWLALVDAKRYDESWKATGAKFRLAISPERWAESVAKVRAPLGAVVKRTTLRTTFTRSFPDVPEGEYAHVIFRAAYANRDDGDETVTLEREADGVWRVIGYVVR